VIGANELKKVDLDCQVTCVHMTFVYLYYALQQQSTSSLSAQQQMNVLTSGAGTGTSQDGRISRDSLWIMA